VLAVSDVATGHLAYQFWMTRLELLNSWLISIRRLEWSLGTADLSVLDNSDGATGQLVYQCLMAQMELLDSWCISV